MCPGLLGEVIIMVVGIGGLWSRIIVDRWRVDWWDVGWKKK